MNPNIKISVIIPCYNVEKYIEQSLDSVINQSYKNIEIIVINDGSTDKTLIYLEKYEKLDNRIKIINQKNQGLSGARNSGIDAATGLYLMFLDSDDWLNLNTIKKCIDQVVNYNLDVVLFSYIKQYNNHFVNQFILKKEQYFNQEGCIYLHQRIIGLNGSDLSNPEQADSLVTAWGKLYKSSIIKENKIRFIDCTIVGSEDILFNVSCFFYIKNAFYVHECLYNYRKNNYLSMTTAYRPKILFQFQVLYDLLETFVKEKKLNKSYHQAYCNRITMSIVPLGLNEIYSQSSFFIKYKNIQSVISSKRYEESIANFQKKHLPLHWKLFYAFCQYKFTIGVYGLLFCINKILNRKNF